MHDDIKIPSCLLWDSKFDSRWPALLTINYIKKRSGIFSKLLIKWGFLKNRWQVVGFMMNYDHEKVIDAMHDLIITEFPNVKIKYHDYISWNDDESFYHTSGGSVKIFLDFENDADEAEFIVRSGTIVSSLMNNKNLVKI